jgi:hypothetical protein
VKAASLALLSATFALFSAPPANAQSAPPVPIDSALGDKGAPAAAAEPAAGDALQLTDRWQGTYYYSTDRGEQPVEFELLLLYDVKTGKLAGHIREPRSFGQGANPWTHAGVRGAFDVERRTLTFTKQYDGANGIHHAVRYLGQLAADGKSVAGTWSIDALNSGKFELHREKIAAYAVSRPDSGAGGGGRASVNLTDAWKGRYAYASGAGKPPVEFDLVLLHDVDTGEFFGHWREPATFGAGPDPWLYATITGAYDPERRTWTWTKEYDGTNRVDFTAEFTGQLAYDGQQVAGKWTRDDQSTGTFEMTHNAGAWRDRQPRADSPNNRPARP